MLKKKPYSGFSSVYDAVMKEVDYKRWSEFILSSYGNYSKKILPKTVLDLDVGPADSGKNFQKTYYLLELI